MHRNDLTRARAINPYVLPGLSTTPTVQSPYTSHHEPQQQSSDSLNPQTERRILPKNPFFRFKSVLTSSAQNPIYIWKFHNTASAKGIQLFLTNYHEMLTDVNYAWMCASPQVYFLPVPPSLRIFLEEPIRFLLMTRR